MENATLEESLALLERKVEQLQKRCEALEAKVPVTFRDRTVPFSRHIFRPTEDESYPQLELKLEKE